MSKEFTYRAVRKDDGTDSVFYPIKLTDREPYELGVLIVPELSRNSRNKEIVECVSNLLGQVTTGLSKNCEYDSDVTEDGLNIEMTHALRELGNLMQYIINSYSFGNDYIASFDAMEFGNRLDMIKCLFERGSERR